jgi:hypothetical protein
MTAELRITSPDETTAADYGRGHGGDPTVIDDLYGTAVGGQSCVRDDPELGPQDNSRRLSHETVGSLRFTSAVIVKA